MRLEIFTRNVGWEKNDRLGTMHTSDHRRSVWYKISGFTPSCEALGHLLKEEEEEEDDDDENSDFAYERFLVWRDEGS